MHTHDKNPKVISIDEKTKTAIHDLIALGIKKPNAILSALEEKGEKVPLLKHLYNHLAYFKKKVFGKSNMSLGELSQYCEEHSAIPGPELPDEPFVTSYDVFMDMDEIPSKEWPINYYTSYIALL